MRLPDDQELTDVERMEVESLDRLGAQFLAALEHLREGRLDEGEDAIRQIISEEPRLAEPHLELARVLLDTDRLADAEEEAREALAQLRAGGVWVEEVEENELMALCHATLAEALRRRADEDDVLFGDPEAFHALVRESRTHFEEAARLDPKDEYASYHAFFMGTPAPEIAQDPDEES